MEYSNFDKKERAKNRVAQLKGFYSHFAIYFFLSTFFTISKVYRNVHNGEGFEEIFWDFNTYAVWIFWGIGVTFHALKVFKNSSILGRGWEERKIREFMKEDEQ